MTKRIRKICRRILIATASALPMSVRQSIHSWPIIGHLQRRLLQSVFANGSLETYVVTAGPARGLRLALQLPQERGFWLGTFELRVAETIAAEVRLGDVCWDVGAYLGYFSALMARNAGRNAVCFEPLPANRTRLETQASLNSDVRFTIRPEALGAMSGEQEFLVMTDTSMGKLANSSFQRDRSPIHQLQVNVRTIDEIVAEGKIPAPTFLKIDTEGAEYQVLFGGRETLARHRPRILLECHGCDDDAMLLELLAELHYRVIVVETNEPLTDQAIQPGQHLLCLPSPAALVNGSAQSAQQGGE